MTVGVKNSCLFGLKINNIIQFFVTSIVTSSESRITYEERWHYSCSFGRYLYETGHVHSTPVPRIEIKKMMLWRHFVSMSLLQKRKT